MLSGVDEGTVMTMRWGVIALSLLLASCAGGTTVGDSSPAGSTTEAKLSADTVTSTSVADGPSSIPELETTDSAPEEDYLEMALAERSTDEGSDVSEPASQSEGVEANRSDSQSDGEEPLQNESTDESSIDTDPTVAVGTGGLSDELIDAIIADAADRLGVEASAVNVVSVESKTFDDSSLGCLESGASYTQVITPGHIVLVEVAGVTLDYRVNDLHGTFKVCE